MNSFINLFVISVSVALDAMSVSVAGGMRERKATVRHALKIALFFGAFQAVMPVIGWLVGSMVRDTFADVSSWIAFALLTLIGLKMIKEAFDPPSEKAKNSILQTKTLLILALATSIDALVVGVTLSLLDIPMILSIPFIGLVAFVLSFVGFMFGKKLGTFFEGKIEIIGGVALIAIGIKALF